MNNFCLLNKKKKEREKYHPVQAKKSFDPKSGLFLAKLNMNVYIITVGSATPRINKGWPPMTECIIPHSAVDANVWTAVITPSIEKQEVWSFCNTNVIHSTERNGKILRGVEITSVSVQLFSKWNHWNSWGKKYVCSGCQNPTRKYKMVTNSQGSKVNVHFSICMSPKYYCIDLICTDIITTDNSIHTKSGYLCQDRHFHRRQ